MDNSLIQIIKGSLDIASSTINSIVGVIITALFLRRNTNATEFEKIKAAKFETVVNDLLDSGEMTYMEYVKCKNFLKIAKKADEYYSKNSHCESTEKEIDWDWFFKFYDYASAVSNEDMQGLWARVLTRAVESPGIASKTLLHALSMMNSDQARTFSIICRFVLRDASDNKPQLLLFISTNRGSYEKSHITPADLRKLERLGLVDCDFKDEYVYVNKKEFRTGNKHIKVLGDESNENKIKAGNAVFTEDGEMLYAAVGDEFKAYRSDILEFTVSKFKSRNCRVIINDREV